MLILVYIGRYADTCIHRPICCYWYTSASADCSKLMRLGKVEAKEVKEVRGVGGASRGGLRRARVEEVVGLLLY